MLLWIDNAITNWEALDKYSKSYFGADDLKNIQYIRIVRVFGLEIKNNLKKMIQIDG